MWEKTKAMLDYMIGQGWFVKVFLIVFLVLLFNYLVYRLLNRLHKKLQATQNPWDDAIIDALRTPIRFLIWFVGIAFAAEVLVNELYPTQIQDWKAAVTTIGKLRDIGVILMVIWFLVRMVKRAEINIIQIREEQQREVDHTTVEVVVKLVRMSIIITGALIVFARMGFNISGVVAFGGVGGIAVGFAAKDLLANFFGAMMIYLDRPFKIGDWVRSPDRKIEGTVEAIGWRLTRIRTFDKRPLYIPNATFTTIAVENPSRMTNRRIYETIGVRYDDAAKIQTIVEKVKEMLINHDEIDKQQTMIVNFNSFAASSLDFFVYTFTKTTNWIKFHKIKQDVLLKIIDIIEAEGAEFAFPTSTLHIPDGINLSSDTLENLPGQ